MVTITSLWLPIIVSAVAVWFTSFVVWMLLPYHRSDYKKLPDEEMARKTLGEQNLPPGLYNIPHAATAAEMQSPEIKEKIEKGPIAFITVMASDTFMNMGSKMFMSFAQNLLVAILVAYMLSATLSADAEYLKIFQIAGLTTWLAYGTAYISDAIWFGRTWKVVGEFLFDAILYAVVTAGVFGWLW